MMHKLWHHGFDAEIPDFFMELGEALDKMSDNGEFRPRYRNLMLLLLNFRFNITVRPRLVHKQAGFSVLLCFRTKFLFLQPAVPF